LFQIQDLTEIERQALQKPAKALALLNRQDLETGLQAPLWLELREEQYGSGRGVFATRHLPKHSYVLDYRGQLFSTSEHEKNLRCTTGDERLSLLAYRLFLRNNLVMEAHRETYKGKNLNYFKVF
jgi:hypothetical protein